MPARVPAIHAETAVKQNPGVLSLVDELVVPNLGAAAGGRARAARAGDRRARAPPCRRTSTGSSSSCVPKAKGEFRIGRELYDEKLGVRADVAAVARRDPRAAPKPRSSRTRARDVRGGAQGARRPRRRAADSRRTRRRPSSRRRSRPRSTLADAERPPRDGVVDLARETLRETTDFVRAKNFVTVPDEPLEIILMPEFQRGVAVAYCDSPGPLDKGQRTFYAVSPIPDDWTDAQVDSFLREYNTRSIANLTIHEAMPGHYLQIAHSNRYPSVLRAMLGSGPFVEGWAVYTERVMQEQGFRGGDPLMQLVQLKWYLRSITNAIMDSAIHVDGMTRDEAMKLMVETGFQEEREAAGKWVRAQLTSAQLSTYFVGYQEHADLRAEAERRRGERFDLKALPRPGAVVRLAAGAASCVR